MYSEDNSENKMRGPQKTKIEKAIALVAKIITERDDGANYIPIYNRLEAELNAFSSQDQRLNEIRKFAQALPTAA
ncbi:hypothetical protein FHS72_000774 [Loktanella ponticola]|uniref:Uncharacterized protein n=1 Tax=Yoonia ponticola TaxID=1524255 RepID=A0A7W9BIH2_9RHOB|nr:hypothetical protein [Yoonia ponticola]MBB5721167.1 hypothetical protein [Yoonia ponticola]